MKNSLLIFIFIGCITCVNAQEKIEHASNRTNPTSTIHFLNDLSVSWLIGHFMANNPSLLTGQKVDSQKRALVENFQINLDRDLEKQEIILNLKSSNTFLVQLSDLKGAIYYEVNVQGDTEKIISTVDLPAQTYFVDLISVQSRQAISTFQIDIEP